MTKVIKEGFKKFKSGDDSIARNTSLEVFHNEFNRLNEMDDDLFTYEVEILELTNVPSSKFYNHGIMDWYTKNVLWFYWARGNEEVELSDEESSYPNDENLIDENEVAKIFRIETNGFKTYVEYKDDWIYEWNKDVLW
nr:hypothetical protein [Tanacetum cinerariifolium]